MNAGEVPQTRLVDVTLVAATSVAIEATVEALSSSMREVEFAEILLLSDRPPPSGSDQMIVWRRIDPITSREAFSRFMLQDLAGHIRTTHALCVQWDGFVLNGDAWDPAFLEYDYIGAVWPHLSAPYNVGNGGFSLRSRRLMEACRHLPFDGSEGEDVFIGRTCRARLEEEGLRFAPEAVARRFAYERTCPTGGEFGFHGAYNLVRLLPTSQALRLFRGLDPALLARNERIELLWWALTRRQLKLAAVMLRRLASAAG